MVNSLIILAALASAADDRAAPCTPIADDVRRLACFDAVFRAPVASEAPQAATTPEAEFGLSGQQKDKRRAVVRETDRIRSLVTAVVPDQPGKPSFTLENGQHWIQTEATDWPAIKTGETLEIRRASLGSFLASVPGSGRPAVRVRRLE